MKQPYVSTLIEQDFTSAEKALGRHNIDAISSADLEGYATQEWVQDQNYITSADMSEYATHEDVESATSGKMDSTEASAFYPRYENPEGYITSADLPDLSDYVTSADVSGFVDLNYVENNFYSASNPSGFVTSGDLPDLSDYATKTYVDENFYSASNPSGFITSADLPDLSEYATIQYVDNSINSATSGKQDSLVFGYTDNKISSINSSAIYGSGGSFTQEQADWTENDNTQVDYIKNKPTPVELKAGSGITLTDETSAVLISSNVTYPTVECQAISVEYSGYVKVVYPQSSACCELHVTTPYRYDAVAEYSAKIDDDKTWAIPSGCWYDFIKQDFDGTQEWCFKDSGHYYG